MEQDLSVFHIWKRIDHHSGHSGYDQLTKHMPCAHYQNGRIFKYLFEKNPRHFRFVRQINPEWYSFEYFCVEMELIARLHQMRNTVFHYLYGENQFRYLGHSPFRRGNRVVASFHQPPAIFPRAIPDVKRVRKADALVVVGSNQVDYFRDITLRDNVYLVPHGIDTDYFAPRGAKNQDGPLRCISVGWWLRDVDMIRDVMVRAPQVAGLDVEFHVVTFPWCQKHYEGIPNVHLHSSVGDEELLALYQKCHLLLLPLQDCTANNAVLESMACGLPVYTSETGAIRDYVGDDNAVIVRPHDTESMLEALLEAHRNRSRLEEMGRASRLRAESFAWERVGERMMDCYRRILQS